MTMTGHCLCGATSFSYEGKENWRSYCHCDSCRRFTGAPVAAYLAVPHGAWAWTGAEPRRYESSPGTGWLSCATCGSAIAYDSDREPDEIHFMAALLDDPSGIVMQHHSHHEERLAWFNLHDDLPKHRG
ncbi:GFA family protein [Pseudoroseicyclus tamaricis]|uniref:GFA family protein n=1 Tax=Pseudoroseicyclus tamaricis TaxID=2705421 RepID=A0A6B2JUG7_9RHOB|nr:GFA family protein [Pseudoroseicyclus tamaricis]NDV01958.1 GFA family protein [Pseudoroseicyclus tamaricis]